MNLLFVLIYLTIIFLLGLCVFKARTNNNKLANSIALLLFSGIVTFVLSGISMNIKDKQASCIIYSLYFMSFDWLVICVLNYAEKYTRNFNRTAWGVIIFIAIACIDNISLLLNPWLHHVFNLQKVNLAGKLNIWRIANTTPVFYMHIVFAYSVVMLSALAFVFKAIKTPKLYKRKYITILVLFFILIICNAIYLIFDYPIDFSLYMYCLFAVTICYYSLFFRSTGFITSILTLAVSNLNDAIFCFDLYNNCVYCNEKAQNFILNTIKDESAKLKQTHDYLNCAKNKSAVNYSKYLRDSGINITVEKRFKDWSKETDLSDKTNFEWTQEVILDNKKHFYRVNYRKLLDSNNIYLGCYFSMSDRTSEVDHFNEEHYKMTHDELTGLYNREYFFETSGRKLQASPDKEYYMLCTNVKGFKLYNDLFGPEQGDEILVTEAELLKKILPADCISGRISGDEFAILIEKNQFNPELFINTIKLMREKFSNNLYQLHIYIGVYDVENYEEAPSIMCDKCKIAIESFKEDYHTIIAYYDQYLLEKSLNERKLVSEFDKALDNHEFCMYLQPQVSTDGRILGAEALVRWNHPEKGLIFPGEFIEIFEKTGHIFRLDRYMWDMAAKQLAEWKKSGNEDLYISVNISAKDFYYMDIYEELTSIVEKYDINHLKLKLEITETALMTEMQNQLSLLKRLRDYGFLIEIDDFGSGYSSLNMLKNIDVDVVKIDMGFLSNTNSERMERSELILDFIISMIKKLGMEVVTEGVETKEQVDNLTEMGSDIFQGYYFSKPITVEEFEKKYLNR